VLVRPQEAARAQDLALATDPESEMDLALALVLGQVLAQATAYLHLLQKRPDLRGAHQAGLLSRRFLQNRLKRRGGLSALPERISS
jgi:hypothetical protein